MSVVILASARAHMQLQRENKVKIVDLVAIHEILLKLSGVITRESS
jgi:hypothetical protein